MSLLQFCQSIQATSSSTWLRESTWGFPILSAIHVLAIAWFGGPVVIPKLAAKLKNFQRLGLAILLLTGTLLFWLEPVKCYKSLPFRIKIGFVLVVCVSPWLPQRPYAVFRWGIWLAILFASRWIAYL